MCGIAVVVDAGVTSEAGLHLLKRMLGELKTRGPDGGGSTFAAGVGLGHRLLRILPSPASSQPMFTSLGAYAITFNGEIYNFRELARELQLKGVVLRTETDTEVLIELYCLYGPGMLSRLKGMFAFAIHDRSSGKVFLARDRMGQKPLYFRRQGAGWRFASQIRPLIAIDEFRVEINEDALRSFLWTLDTFTGQTFFRGIEQLPAGYSLTIQVADGSSVLAKFSDVAYSVVPGTTIENAAAELRSKFEKAMEAQTKDVPSAACHLSGGLDSSAIAETLSRQRLTQFTSYSCSYLIKPDDIAVDERGFEEIAYARLVMDHVGIKGETVRVGADDYYMDVLDLVETLEEPKGNPCLPHFELARCISARHRIFFSGEGADELFGGYWWKLAHSAQSKATGHFDCLAPAPPALLQSILADRLSDSTSIYDQYSEGMAGGSGSALDRIMLHDLKRFLQHLLLQADKIAGRFGLEGRYPFLDDDIVDFALTLPAELRFEGSTAAKPVLRQMLRDSLPAEILARPKVGFVPPEGGWYRSSLESLVRYVLSDPRAYVHQLLKGEGLERLLAEHMSRRANFRKLIWGLICVELWHRRFVLGEDPQQMRDGIHRLRFDSRALSS